MLSRITLQLLSITFLFLYSFSSTAQLVKEKHLVFSAHLDDDVIFMNNDIYDAIRKVESVTTVYFVSVQEDLQRENGVRAAYAEMAGFDDWVNGIETVNGVDIAYSELASNPDIKLYFMRVPDGGSGNSLSEQLWDRSINSFTTWEGTTYTRDSLINTLNAFMEEHQPNNILTHARGSADVGGDHGEHLHFAEFVWAARDIYTTSHDVDEYVGYGVASLPETISGQALSDKVRFFEEYGAFDQNALNIPVFRDWLKRQYYVGRDGRPTDVDWDIREGQALTVNADAFQVGVGESWDVIGNVLSNDNGVGLTVINGYEGFLSGSYVYLAPNGDLRVSQRGQFLDLVSGQSRSIAFDYDVADSTGVTSRGTVSVRVVTSSQKPSIANADIFQAGVGESWNVVGNVLSNDVGTGLTVTRGYEGFLNGSYTYLAPNGDLRVSQRGQFEDLAPGQSRSISFEYEVTDANGVNDMETVSLVVSAPELSIANSDTFQIGIGESWSVIGNVLSNDEGNGLTVTNGYEGFIGGSYIFLAPNGDLRVSQRGQFNDLTSRQSRTISLSYEVRDSRGIYGTASVDIVVTHGLTFF